MALKRIPLKGMSRVQWQQDRVNYLGGSDSGTILGHNDYMSRVELYYQKLGVISPGRDSRFTIAGRLFEDSIAKLFSYWTGDEDELIYNFNTERPVREIRRTNFRYYDERWPWLSCNLDRFGKENGRRSIVECKNMGDWVENKWEAGIPLYFITQVNTYMGVLGMDHAYIAVMVGGNRLEVFSIDFSQIIFDSVVESSKDFWDRLTKSRAIIKKTGLEGNELIGMLAAKGLEPSGENNDAYADFLKRKWEAEEGMRLGSQEHWDIAHSTRGLKLDIKKLTDELTAKECMLKEAIGPAEGIEWPLSKEKLTWKGNKNGKRTLRYLLDE
jgi:hypothetical protein